MKIARYEYEPVMGALHLVPEKAPILRRFRTAKEAVIHYYGGCCAECGFADLRALELHHINIDGKDNRISYSQIVKKGFPDGLQLLCANCHRIAHSRY